MNIRRVIINRILFRFVPIIGLLIAIVYFKGITLGNILHKISIWDILLLAALGYFSYDLIRHFKKRAERNKTLKNAKLYDNPTEIKIPRRLNFLDKRISFNERSIDITFKNNVILYLNKDKKKLELKKTFGKKNLSFNDIQFIFLEYNQYEKDTLIDHFSPGSSFDKNIWNNAIRAQLKNGKQITLFEAQLEETNNEALVNYQISGKHEEKSYLENGINLIRLFSFFMEKKYLIIDNRI